MKKICSSCKIEKDYSDYSKRSDRPLGIRSKCKQCESSKYKAWSQEQPPRRSDARNKAYQTYYQNNKEAFAVKNAKRRALTKNSVPSWAEHEKIKMVYAQATKYGFEVDHIVPLQSDTVCGLHCWANLQLLDPSINRSKGNREWADMP